MIKQCINQQWLFTQQEKSATVNLPHTWNGLDGQDGGNNYYRGICCYQKSLLIDATGEQRLHLEFDGANSICKVYVNDCFIGEHQGGYSTFRFDITDVVNKGAQNSLRVEVDNQHYDDIYPLMADFTFMGGLYRNVSLIYSNPIHIDLDDDGSCGVYVSQTNVSEQIAELSVDVLLNNHYPNAQDVGIKLSLLNADKISVASSIATFLVTQTSRATLDLSLSKPILWQGTENPYLYTLLVEIIHDEQVVDIRGIATGLRFFKVSPSEGFFLNGKSLSLKGVCRHQDREDIGWALTEQHQNEDMAIIEAIGANSIRLAHYQHNNYFYDLCDQSGMVVWAEIPYITRSSDTDTEGKNALSQMQELVKQNYNHPAIIFWGVQNEITIGGKGHNVTGIIEALHQQTKALDPYRLTTQAQVAMLPNQDSLNTITDINAYNKYFGWYNGQVEEFDAWLTEFHQQCPDVPVAISEYGAEGIQKYHSDTPRRSDYSEEYHALYHEKVLAIFKRHPQLWATYVWNMFDFACDLRDEGGVKGMNNKGLVRHDHQTRKDAFYIYQANWSDKPMLHICSKGFAKRQGDTLDIKVYSNCSEVTLLVDGKKHATMSGNLVFNFTDIAFVKTTINIQAVNTTENLSDSAQFEQVQQPVASYVAPRRKNPLKEVNNWFDPEVEPAPLVFKDGYFSINSRICDVLAKPEGEAFIKLAMAPLFDHAMFDFIKNLSFVDLAGMSDGAISDGFLAALNQGLSDITAD